MGHGVSWDSGNILVLNTGAVRRGSVCEKSLCYSLRNFMLLCMYVCFS